MALTKTHNRMVAGAVANVLDFGAVGDDVADDTAAIQAAIDSSASGLTVYLPAGVYRITDTILLKRNSVRLVGDGFNATRIHYVNAAGGIAVSGDSAKTASLNAYSYCGIEGIAFGPASSNATEAANAPDIVLDITSFSYSTFDVAVQTLRTNGICIYGQGNAGTSPYYNRISGYLFGGDIGGTNFTQTGIKFAQGAWAGGSNGPNANIIKGIGRAAALDILIDLQAGTGNMFSEISGESINTAYWRLNFNPAVDSGTSTGSNTSGAFNDTGKSWTTNQYVNGAVKITGGTGAGQVRMIASNTATQLSVRDAWAVVPDNTSTYEIYLGKAQGNTWTLGRGEGLASLNPDFVQAYPGTDKTRMFANEVQSLGTGVFVRDESGSGRNSWYGDSKVSFTESVINPGASANIDLYPKLSVFGGVGFAGNYAVEWLNVRSITTSLGDDATVRLDAGGTGPGTGNVTLTAVLTNGNSQATAFAAPDKKIGNRGANNGVFLNVQTGASFSATADLQITWCVSLT